MPIKFVRLNDFAWERLRRKARLLVVSSVLLPSMLIAQADTTLLVRTGGDTLNTSPSKVNGLRLAVVGGVTTASIVAIHFYQENAWWKGSRSTFHFREDLIYAKNVDKVGHLYAANVLTFVFSRSLQWAEVPDRQSLIWGAIGSTLFQTYVETEDGFSKYWGFDRVDFAGDVLGAWYPVIQDLVPPLQSFNFKFSYLPKNSGSRGAIPGQTFTIFDDYEGQTLWLSVSMHSLLPRPVDGFWPAWLALAAGVAVKDNLTPHRYLVFYLAPDLDTRAIIPSNTRFLKTLGEALNFIHFPMPAVRISPDVVWYGLYF